MRKQKIKKIAMISLVTLLAIGTLGISLAFFGKGDFTKVKDTIKDTIVREEETKENVNIIKNSNFKVNTTNVTMFTEETNSVNDSMLLDDWKLNLGTIGETLDFTMYQVAEGFYVRNDGDISIYLAQKIDEGVALYANKELTLTISIDDVVYSASGVLTESNQIQVVVNSLLGSHVSIYINNNTCAIGVSLKSGVNSIINWIQLEEGPVFTGYVAPTIDAVA